jgi:S-adenosylmethionine hydrolase
MGIVTLLSDFGLQDASVASAKGILMQYIPESQLIDISHQLEPFYLQQAAYLISSSHKSFPQGTCHILLFDVFYGTAPTLVLCEAEGQYFLAPDNGLISLALGRAATNVRKCFELPPGGAFKDWVHFTGTMAQAIQNGSVDSLQLPAYELRNAPQHLRPKIDGNTVECHVIHIDRFENVVLNITREQFEKTGRNRSFRIQFMRDEEISEISARYNDVKEGEKLCRFNTSGHLEIAINRGKAASLLGLTLSREQHLMYNTIKIVFE